MLERELKLEAPPGFRVPDLNVRGLETVKGSWRYLDAVYFDTEDLRLTRWGCGLRYRTEEGWTVKLAPVEDQDLQQRPEVAFEGSWDQIPDAAAALVRVYARWAPLQQLARMRTVRKPLFLVDGRGRSVAEIVDDDVSTYVGRGPAGRFREIGIELAESSDQKMLDEIVARLQGAGAGSTTNLSKLSRAIGKRALHDPEVVVIDLDEEPGTGDVIQAAFARSVRRFMVHMPEVQLGRDPEALHQARVATRRLRSDLRTFGPMLDEQWVLSLRDELRWLGGSLGTVRDIDVLTLRLIETSEQLLEADRYPLHVLMTMLEAERKKRRRAMLEAMSQSRFLELTDRMIEAANAPRLLPASDSASREALLELVRAPFDRLMQTTLELPTEPVDIDLHRIRIRAKRVRYAAEAVAPVIGKKAVRFASAASVLQDALGELQDSAVAHAWLSQAALEHPAVAFAAGQLAGFELVRADSARRGWGKSWRKLSREKLRSWM